MHLTDRRPTQKGLYYWAPPDAPEVAILVRVRVVREWWGHRDTLELQALEEVPYPWQIPRRAWAALAAIAGLWSSEPLPEAPTEVRRDGG